MRYNSDFDVTMDKNRWFGNNSENICFLQDIVHIGTKLRNRLLKPSICLIIGNKPVSVSHLKMLLNSVSKGVHGLTYSTICPDDRQNYGSLEKIMKPEVSGALTKHIIDSEATVEYVRICYEITSSIYEEKLAPLDRMFRLWRTTYFLRAWRLSIAQKVAAAGEFKISENFITQNSYACIELIARNFVIMTKKFRDENLKELFVPTVFNSQPCEETYRKLRSMGTINFTKINFTLLDLMHLIGRVELMNDIMYFKLADSEVHFPRNRINESNLNEFELPSDDEIKICLDNALEKAIIDASKFGIIAKADGLRKCMLKNVQIELESQNQFPHDNIDLGIASSSRKKKTIECATLRNYFHESDASSLETSPFITIGDKTIRKSSFIGVLSDTKQKLSSDRLKRVQDSSDRKQRSVRRKLEFVDVSPETWKIQEREQIQIGDWCIFDNTHEENEGCNAEFIIGNILSFKYIEGTTEKSKQYSWDFVPVRHENNLRGVQVFSSWYRMSIKGEIDIDIHGETKCIFININRYVLTVKRESLVKHEKKLCVLQDCQGEITNFLQKHRKNAQEEVQKRKSNSK